VAQDAAFQSFIGHLVIDNSTIKPDVYTKTLALSSANNPALGAPFNAGDSLFDRAEAWYTDNFLSPPRNFFQQASLVQPMFAYYFREFIPGTRCASSSARRCTATSPATAMRAPRSASGHSINVEPNLDLPRAETDRAPDLLAHRGGRKPGLQCKPTSTNGSDRNAGTRTL